MSKFSFIADRFAGSPGVVAASGWSLRDMPDEALNNYPVFAVNASYRYFEQNHLKQPEYLVSVDARFPKAYRDIFDKFGDDFLHVRYPYIANQHEWKDIHGYSLEDTGGKIIVDGSSSHAALHLALIAGCNPIYIAGVDLSMNPNMDIYATDEPLLQPRESFSPSWSTMFKAFDFIATLVKPGQIYDCSLDGKLTAFPKLCPKNIIENT